MANISMARALFGYNPVVHKRDALIMEIYCIIKCHMTIYNDPYKKSTGRILRLSAL